MFVIIKSPDVTIHVQVCDLLKKANLWESDGRSAGKKKILINLGEKAPYGEIIKLGASIRRY